jgi:DNA invertase Pin-like site-specific DNA recombinase
MRLVGYARVSTDEQELLSQRDALEAVGCTSVYTDKASGAKSDRPGLEQCLAALQEGDTLVVYRLDRLGRSMIHLVDVVESLRKRGVGIRSLSDGAIDTTTASGELVFHIFAALAQFERSLVRERTKAGLDAARARGRVGGRKPVTSSDPKVIAAKAMHSGGSNIGDICEAVGVSRATLYRYLAL